MCDEVCRLCLKNQDLSLLFVDIEEVERYSIVLELVTGLKIRHNDGLPQKICKNCMNSINSIMLFRNQCQLTEAKLLKMISKREDLNGTKNTENLLQQNGISLENNTLQDFNDSNQDFFDKDGSDVCDEENNTLQDDSNHDSYDKDGSDVCDEDFTSNYGIFASDNEYINIQNTGEKTHEERESLQMDNFLDDSQENSLNGNGITLIQIEVEPERRIDEQQCLKNRERLKLKLQRGNHEIGAYVEDGAMNGPNDPITCKSCRKPLSNWASFKKHVKAVHLSRSFQCKYCQKMLTKKWLIRHWKTCREKFLKKTARRRTDTQPEVLFCGSDTARSALCDGSTRTDEHQRRVKSGYSYNCTYCKYCRTQFRTPKELRSHWKSCQEKLTQKTAALIAQRETGVHNLYFNPHNCNLDRTFRSFTVSLDDTNS